MNSKRAFRGGGQVLVLVALCAVLLSGAAAAQDQFEPNDDFETAAEVSPGEYTGLSIEDGESDFFAVEVQEGEGLRAAIEFSHADGDLDMRVYDTSEFQVGSSASFSDDESVTVTTEESGIHYVEVYGFDGASADYSLELATGGDVQPDPEPEPDPTPSLDPDRFEPNDNLDAAAAVSVGQYTNLTVQSGESDFYAIDLRAGEQLDVAIEFSHDEGDLDLEVYDTSESTVESSTSATDNESVTVTAEESGTHYVEVYGYAGASAAYSMELTVSGDEQPDPDPEPDPEPDPDPAPSLDADRFEPNDNLDAAAAVSAGEYTDLTVQNGESDFYAIDLPEGANLTAEIEFSHADGDLDMRGYGPDETIVGNSTSLTDDESVTLTAAEGGTHYVEVYGYLGASAAYSLELSGSGVSSENNGTNEDNESDGGDEDDGDNEGDADDEDGESGDSGDGFGPGFGLVSALAGLGGAGYLLRRVGSEQQVE